MAVQKKHGSPGIIYGDKNKNVINDYQFCGVRNVLHLYPKALNVEMIYKNNKVITESDFSFLFQVIDIGLVETVSTKVMHADIGIYDPTQLHIAGGTSAVAIFQVIVAKLNGIRLKINPGNQKYIIYFGPIVDEQLRLITTTGGSVKIPSFQSTIIVDTKPRFLGDGIRFSVDLLKLKVYGTRLERNKATVRSLPNAKCTHRQSICALKVIL